jgi:4-hydroxy-tetrahydrodipicolinate reductase
VIRVGVMGLGPVGRAIARAAAQHGGLALRAAVDRDPALAGRRLDELAPGAAGGVTVAGDVRPLLADLRGGVLLHATGSRLAEVAAEILSAVEARVSVVSACPDLVYPWHAHPKLARAIDRAASEAGVAVLATGVNPGFVLDRLLVAAAAASGNLRSARARRSVDISGRREALLRKAGVGLSLDAFRERAAAGAVGPVGLAQSAALVAAGLGLGWDAIDEATLPVVAERPLEGPVALRAGDVAGYRQRACALEAGRPRVELELTYAVGAPDRDTLAIDADPPVALAIEGGISGDLATAWSVVNAAPALRRAQPGLRSVLDLPAGGRTTTCLPNARSKGA